MKKQASLVFAFAFIAALSVIQPSVVSACGTCSLGRPATPTLTGQLVGLGGASDPFHAGVSFDPADTMNSSPSNVTPGNTVVASMLGLNGTPGNRVMLPSSFANAQPFDTTQLLALVPNSNAGNVGGFTSPVMQPSTLSIGNSNFRTDSFTSNDSGSSDLTSPGLAPVGGITVVPEPAALLLLCLGLFAGVKCRRA